MTDVAYSTPAPDRPAKERVSGRSAVLAPWLLLGIGLAGVTSHDSQPIESRVFEIVKEDLTQHFGGVTAYTRSPAEGRWRGDRTHIEGVVVFEVLCSELDRHCWNAYRQRLENDFPQQSVLIGPNPLSCPRLWQIVPLARPSGSPTFERRRRRSRMPRWR